MPARAIIAVLATFLGAAAYLGLPPGPAAACSCVAPETEQWIRDGRAAILGKPVLVLRGGDAVYEVEQSFNVTATRHVTVYGGAGGCGLWPSLEDETQGIFFEVREAEETAVDELDAWQCLRVTKRDLLDGADAAGIRGRRPLGAGVLANRIGWQWIAAGAAGALTASVAMLLVGYRLGAKAGRRH